MAKLNDHKARAHALLSASSAARWLACPPSAVAAEAYPEQETEFAAEGTLAHEVAEAVASRKDVPFDEGVTQQMMECAVGYSGYIDELKTQNDAVVLLEQRVDFSPWVPGGFGTCDCLIIQGHTLTVVDYKYGVGVPVSAVENPQMKLYALGALNDFGIAYDIDTVEMHIYQPRINNVSAWGCSEDELMTWAEETVKPTAALASSGNGKYSAGAQCKFCPHAARCRELASVCTQAVEAHDIKAKVPVLSPHEVAEVLGLEPLVTLWLKRVKAYATDTLLNGGEVPGYKVVEGRSSRAWVDEALVMERLRDADFQASDYLEQKLMSPAGLEGSIGKKVAAELVGGLVEKKAGSPTVVPDSDKREPINRLNEAQKDFE